MSFCKSDQWSIRNLSKRKSRQKSKRFDLFDLKNPIWSSEIYSFSTNSWKDGPELPRGFQYGGYVSDENHSLLLISGIDEHGNIRDDIMQYNQTKNIFETLPGKIEKRRTYFTSSAIETDEDCWLIFWSFLKSFDILKTRM